MKIEVARLKDDPVVLEESFDAARWDMDNYDVKFEGAVHLKCAFARYGNEILVDVEAGLMRNSTCARCLKETKENVRHNFKLNYNALTAGDTITVDDDIREQVLLNRPMRFLCKEDCKGICPGCGVDLNIERCKCCGGKS